MRKARNAFIKNLRYLCLVCVIAMGLITIVGSNGDGGGGEGGVTTTTTPTTTTTTTTLPPTVVIWKNGSPGSGVYEPSECATRATVQLSVDDTFHSSEDNASLKLEYVGHATNNQEAGLILTFTEPKDMSEYADGHIRLNICSARDHRIALGDTNPFVTCCGAGCQGYSLLSDFGFVPDGSSFRSVVMKANDIPGFDGLDFSSIVRIVLWAYDYRFGSEALWVDNIRWTAD